MSSNAPVSQDLCGRSQKPKMLFLAPQYEDILVVNNHEPVIHRIHAWLNYHFDVVHISADCNLARLIDQHKPEIILYDGILECCEKLRFRIEDRFDYPEVPRAAWCCMDSLSPARLPAFEYMLELGSEIIFVFGDTSMGQAIPELQQHMVYIPQFINPALYKDYGMPKTIPVLMVGNFDCGVYPWREAVRDTLLARFPTLYFRHPGYSVECTERSPVVLYGEKFARTINSALIVPTSGGFKSIGISKHVEIPGARACMVTDKTPGIELYGYEHMKHCVYATAKEAPDAIEMLLRNPDVLQQITDTGYEFAHKHHTLRERDQMIQWLALRKELKAGQRIVQPHPMQPLKIVDAQSEEKTPHLKCASDFDVMDVADRKLWEGKYEEAAALYEGALKFCHYMTEPKLRLALSWLFRGATSLATQLLLDNVRCSYERKALNPDPIDAAYLIIALLCWGNPSQALEVSKRYARIRRVELDRARWAVWAALDQEAPFSLSDYENSRQAQAPTIHMLPKFSFEEQMEVIIKMLRAAKEHTFAENLVRNKDKELAYRAMRHQHSVLHPKQEALRSVSM